MTARAGKTVGKLSAAKVASVKRPGLYGDGANLYLKVDEGGSKSWILRFKVRGRSRKFGLGALHTVPLALAREKAAEARRLLLDGKDPIEEKRAAKAARLLETAKSITFDACADAYIETNKSGWRNGKHASEWTVTLKRYASPVFGQLSVAAVDRGLILRALGPIWNEKPTTASRVRQRIERVLDYAKANGYRDGENPAAWKGGLDHILPRADKVKATQHFAAMPHVDVGALVAKLTPRRETAAAALAFTILTAARSGEVIGAQWDEIDLEAKLWTVPSTRMKSAREHRVPLSDAAMAILSRMQKLRESGFVFPGVKPNQGVSETTMPVVLRRVAGPGATVHGFRSSFRDWAAEQTAFPREVAEACLAHAVSDKTEAAYRRTEFLEKRRKLMAHWARYLASPAAEAPRQVIPLAGRRGK